MSKTYVVVDVESDGPYPGDYSMVSFGAVILSDALDVRFKGQVAPICKQYDPETLAVSKTTREAHEKFESPVLVMPEFVQWLERHSQGKIVMLSDNVAHDWQFLNYYCHKFAGRNPMGYTARRIGDFCAGLEREFEATSNWKALRDQELPHDPLEDAVINARAFLRTLQLHGVDYRDEDQMRLGMSASD